LRIFFVLIDCLPVLVKFSSGQTPYDEQAGSLIEESKSVYELRREARLKVAKKQIDAEAGAMLVDAERITQLTAFKLRQHAAQLEELESEAIDREFARRMSETAGTGSVRMPGAEPSPLPTARIPRQMNGKVVGATE
jgi:hypothetical protein